MNVYAVKTIQARVVPWLMLSSLFVLGTSSVLPGTTRAPILSTLSRQSEASSVKYLKVRIVTARRRGAGTDNAVYFDIGPLAWKLGRRFHNDFESGDDDTYLLPVPKGFTTADILWLRLHKKGIAGYTGTRDGFSGAWHPQSITVFVNDDEFTTVQISSSLNSRCWYWRSNVSSYVGLNLLVRSLRINPNEKLGFVGKTSAFLTTKVFKNNGISGWLSSPAQKECRSSDQEAAPDFPSSICVMGEVTRKDKSTDGYETIDMRLTQIESCPVENQQCAEQLTLDASHGFSLPRYIRIENRYAHNRVRAGGVTRICGALQWDTDREGWWEIHTRNEKDLLRRRTR